MNVDNPLKLISLCTGYAGLDIGIDRATGRNTRPVAYCEREMYAAKNLCAKIEEGKLHPAPIFTDVKTFPFAAFRGKVDIITGGYPCQPFSFAGKRLGREDPRHLWPYIAKGIRAARPSLCFFENVEGHLSEGFREVSHSLRRLGYSIEAGIFSAAEVGAPHQRKRLFILGVGDSEYARQLVSRSIKATQREPRGQEGSIKQSKRSSKLSYADSKRRDGDKLPRRQGEKQSRTPLLCSNVGRWPARPNEQQHEWEEPRTKPKMGRAVNGARSRVDELRLLGNGVVPATAELAFRTLIEKFM